MANQKKPGPPEPKQNPPVYNQPLMNPVDRNKRLQEYFERPGKSQKVNFQSLREVEQLIKNFDDMISRRTKTVENLKKTVKNLGLEFNISEFLESNRVFFKALLYAEAEKAFNTNIDLNYPTWRTHLLSRLQQLNGLIEVNPIIVTEDDRRIFRGFEVFILEHLQERLGTIQDYADVVRIVRSELNYGNKVTNGALASHLWYSRLWIPGRLGTEMEVLTTTKKEGKNVPLRKKAKKKLSAFYKKIMRSRLEEMGTMAPYWELLDNGFIEYPGDKGGYAKPDFAPSWFVSKAEDTIKAWCEARFNTETVTANELDLRKQLEEKQKHLNELLEVRELLKDLTVELNYENIYSKTLITTMTALNLAFAFAIQRARNVEVLSKITANKIELFANQVIAGQQVAKRLYFWTSGRAETRARTYMARLQVTKALIRENLADTLLDRPELVIQQAKKRIAELQTEIRVLQAKGGKPYP